MIKLFKLAPLAAVLLLTACSMNTQETKDSKDTFNNVSLQASQSPSSKEECSLAYVSNFASSLLDPYMIPNPVFDLASSESLYVITKGVVYLEPCASKEIIAHEVGHYVFDVFAGFDYGQHLLKAESIFCPQSPDCPGPWGPDDESSPGIEIAAHCIAEILYKKTSYTECPTKELSQTSREILVSLIDTDQTSPFHLG
jgi:hypothetical protein